MHGRNRSRTLDGIARSWLALSACCSGLSATGRVIVHQEPPSGREGIVNQGGNEKRAKNDHISSFALTTRVLGSGSQCCAFRNGSGHTCPEPASFQSTICELCAHGAQVYFAAEGVASGEPWDPFSSGPMRESLGHLSNARHRAIVESTLGYGIRCTFLSIRSPLPKPPL